MKIKGAYIDGMMDIEMNLEEFILISVLLEEQFFKKESEYDKEQKDLKRQFDEFISKGKEKFKVREAM